MKVLITGAQGLLGRTLCRILPYDIIATDRTNGGDITDARGLDACIETHRPDVIVHCAAMTAVDLCEGEPELAFAVNAQGTAHVAASADRWGARLIAVSTDYVFDGQANRPYSELDTPNGGVCVYGRSKWAAEQSVRALCPDHIIARTSWLYGPGGPSFVHTLLGLADGSRPSLRIVQDQRGNPTSTLAVARALIALIQRPSLRGTFHLSCEGEASWFEFAREILNCLHIDQVLVGCSSNEYPRAARRPLNSRLEKQALRLHGLPPMPLWQDALREFLSQQPPLL